MGGRSSRVKGASGEREVIKIMQEIVDEVYAQMGRTAPRLERRQVSLGRFVRKGADIDGLPWASIEVKRQEDLRGLEGWWRQCTGACREGQIPILIWRVNNGKWTVRFKPYLAIAKVRIRATVTVDIDTFLVYFRERLKYEIGARQS